MYSAEISRKNPGCFIFLLDQSASMEDPFGGSSDRRKADELATIINKLIHNLSIRCAKGDSIYDYFHVAVIGYGQDTVVKSAFNGPLSGKDLIPISELADNPLRIEDRTKKAPEMAQRWVAEHPKGFPPIVINITDGEATDGDPVPEAKALASVGSDDGATLVFNIHLSSATGNPVELPASDEGLPDKFAKQLYEMSSSLTPFMIGRAKELGMPADDGARGFVFNAQPMQVIQFLDIGTRPANLR